MVGKHLLHAFLFTIVSLTFINAANAQKKSSDGIWSKVDESSFSFRAESERSVIPSKYETFILNKSALDSVLRRAPKEFTEAARNSETELTVPLPDGKFERFRIQEAQIMEPALAAKFPELKSYRGQGIDDPTSAIYFDLTVNGFRAMISSTTGTKFVEPYAKENTSEYIAFNKSDVVREGDKFHCEVGGDIVPKPEEFKMLTAPSLVTNGSNLRIFRLALAATGEYTNVFRQAGDSDTQAKSRSLSQMFTTMNRVNGVYEREIAVRMVFVGTNDTIIYTDGATDPYTNTSGSTMLGENQSNLDSMIGSANYDIGHVFSTGGGGIATLNSPCNPLSKARGVTGLGNPTGDFFAIDYVSHEMGHQFGGSHTYNAGNDSCASQRSVSNSFEPGSGVTIMAYAGICPGQNLASRSIDNFHVRSLEQILNFLENIGTCSTNSATGNSIPFINAVGGTSWNIPKQTPFVLNAIGGDADNDSVTFDWNQYNNGGATGTVSVPNTDLDGVPRPIFRNYLPTSSGVRYFPSLQYVRNNANVPPANTGSLLTGELLPAITRTMNFQAVIRDNRLNGGGINSVSVTVNVDGNSGPFTVTSPNTAVTLNGNSAQTITWNVANTNIAPVSAENVRISLSTDGGFTFPTVLSSSTPNDGSESVILPNVVTTAARIRIEAVNNIFFDMSNVNFSISATTPSAPRKLFDYDGDGKSDVAVYRPSNGTWYILQSQSGFYGSQFGAATDLPVSGDFDGDGKFDISVFRSGNWYWLNSSNGAFNAVQFGQSGDQPVIGDYDGDGKTDQTVYRAGNWYIRPSSTGGFRAEFFGLPTDKPMVGDYDGDGKADIAVYRPSDGTWYVMRSQLGFTAMKFGISSDIPIPADYDGDGKTDYAVYRNGNWYLWQTQAGFYATLFGLPTDIPVPADYDGDGKTDVAVFRSSDGNWYQMRSSSGFTSVQFGTNGDIPIEAQNISTP